MGSSTVLFSIGSMPTTHQRTTMGDLTLVSSDATKQQNFTSPSRKFTDEFQIKYAQKVKEAKNLLSKVGDDPLEGLVMVDAIQRLCIGYLFRDEIKTILEKQYVESRTHFCDSNNLYEASLRFCLLRQEGYNVTPDVFDVFKNNEGKFKEKLSVDIMGLMGLYEASQLSLKGENILDEAAIFSSHHLKSSIAHLHQGQSRIVENALKHPYYKTAAIFAAQTFLRDFRGANWWQKVLKEVAQLEFIMVKSMYQSEVLEVSKWWKELGLAKKLRFARDQPVKWYLWPMAMLTDPSLSEQRIDLTKPISLIYVIDDIFDVYGTLDQLTLFTQTVNRWEVSAVEKLPDYMRHCFKALDDITNQISNKVYKNCGWDPTDHLRRAWGSLCNAYLVEAKWFCEGQLPNSDEYLKNGIISSGVHVLLVHLFFLLGDGITNETASLVSDNPAIVSSVATILRLWNDMGSAKDEKQDRHDGSYVKCYMKENQGSSTETAHRHVTNKISETWKLLNQECLFPNSPYTRPFRNASMNAARMVPLMYGYDENHRLPILEEHIKSMLLNSPSQKRCLFGQ